MQYIQVQFNSVPGTEIITDILSAQLAEIGFESFVSLEGGLEAYVPASLFSADLIDELLSNFPMKAVITWRFNEMEDKNWNEEWEKNYFEPIVIDDVCCIHSSFHHLEGTFAYRILIDPKMAFGTGHHQTTGLILSEILSMNLMQRSVLDMGCGTALLAILASMKKADPITAIDIDVWAYNNALENVQLNGTDNIRLLQGGAELLGDETFDVILANINRNILLRDIPSYNAVLNKHGMIIMSGFYKEDIPSIRVKCEDEGLTFSHFAEKDQWVAVTFVK
ncbi:MAG: 50S ribosomal protein L11 methyltransferase [Proteiniphilum sp.]|nr:50S ribosomal protein L11 methyltransferase [Proteiniphilum sp.]